MDKKYKEIIKDDGERIILRKDRRIFGIVHYYVPGNWYKEVWEGLYVSEKRSAYEGDKEGRVSVARYFYTSDPDFVMPLNSRKEAAQKVRCLRQDLKGAKRTYKI